MYENEKSKNPSAKAVVTGFLVVILLILGTITLFTSIRKVGTGYVGVVTQYGKVTGRELSEGMSFVAPWGVQKVKKYDTKVQKEETPDVAAATKDLQDAKATIVLNYQLERGKVTKIHQTIGKDYSEKLIAPAVQEVFKASAAKFTASQSITDRPALKADVVKGLKDRLEPFGITVLDVSLTNFAFSAAFNNSIEQTQVAQQEVLKAKQELEKAKVEADRKVAEAEGAAEAQRLQQQTLTEDLLRKQWIEKWDGKLPTYTGGDANFYMPIK